MKQSILIKGGNIVTMDERDSIVSGDLFIKDGRIQDIGGDTHAGADVVIDAQGCVVLPGFVQTL